MADGGERSSLQVQSDQTAAAAERAVLGACLVGGQPAIDDAQAVGLAARDFARAAHQHLWTAMQAVGARGDTVELVGVVDELHRAGHLDACGGASGVAGLGSVVLSAATVTQHARMVVEAACMRRLASVCQVYAQAAIAREGSAADLLAEAQEAILALSRVTAADEWVDRPTEVDHLLREAASGKAKRGLPTGWSGLDSYLEQGMRPGQLFIVAARPSMGKSVLGHQLAGHVADQGIPAAFFSLEMSGSELLERELIQRSKLSRREWSQRDAWHRVTRAGDAVKERPLHLVECPGISITELCGRARRMVARQGIGLAVVDYLQLVKGSGAYAGSRTQEVGEVSRGLKTLAGELKIPIVALAQLNRANEATPDKRPTLAHLRDSGEIEQDADVVGFIHRPEYYLREKTPSELQGVAEIILAKQRNGPTGIARLAFDGPTVSFVDVPQGREYQ
jgi:replicative DNA helicase